MKLLKAYNSEASEEFMRKKEDITSTKAKSRWKMVKNHVISLGREKLVADLRSGGNSDGSIETQKLLRLGFIIVEEAFGTKLKDMVRTISFLHSSLQSDFSPHGSSPKCATFMSVINRFFS